MNWSSKNSFEATLVEMAKKYAIPLFSALLIFVAISTSANDSVNSLVLSANQKDGFVNKAPGNPFIVEIVFQNTGKTEGNWSINIAFEGKSWFQSGLPQNLQLEPGKKETLTWNGFVPTDAAPGSVARLVVYYDDSHKALDWRIQVTPNAELTIKSSSVE
jgi:hypothetical protein